MKRRLFTVLVIACSIFACVLGFYLASTRDRPDTVAIPGLLWPAPKSIQAFEVHDHEGRPFGLRQLQGHWSLLFFGYSYCPDICPVTLAVLNQVYQVLKPMYPAVQVVFVSVDPGRDDQQRLSDYVTHFNPEFFGLGGRIEQIQTLTQQIGVPYYYSTPDEQGDYTVDHSASLFLLDRQARLVGILSAPHERDQIVSQFTQIAHFIERHE